MSIPLAIKIIFLPTVTGFTLDEFAWYHLSSVCARSVVFTRILLFFSTNNTDHDITKVLLIVHNKIIYWIVKNILLLCSRSNMNCITSGWELHTLRSTWNWSDFKWSSCFWHFYQLHVLIFLGTCCNVRFVFTLICFVGAHALIMLFVLSTYTGVKHDFPIKRMCCLPLSR